MQANVISIVVVMGGELKGPISVLLIQYCLRGSENSALLYPCVEDRFT